MGEVITTNEGKGLFERGGVLTIGPGATQNECTVQVEFVDGRDGRTVSTQLPLDLEP